MKSTVLLVLLVCGSALAAQRRPGSILKAGFDQVPTGSNRCSDVNFANTVAFCGERCAPERIKGYMMAPWTRTFASHEDKAMKAVAQMAETIRNSRRGRNGS